MKHVECLSRDGGAENCDILCITKLTELEWVKVVQHQDEGIIDILHFNKTPENKNCFENFAIKNDVLYRQVNGKLKWVAPKVSRWLVCKLNYDDCGHLGLEKTLKWI